MATPIDVRSFAQVLGMLSAGVAQLAATVLAPPRKPQA